MIVAKRRNEIKHILLDEKSVTVSSLVKLFDVSEETIRRDLNFLEKEGFLEKNYGGAILSENISAEEDTPPINKRQKQFFNEKKAIGQKAAELVQSGQTIILDAGTTTWHMTKELNSLENLTVITNAINIAEDCSKNKDTSIYLLGGKLRRNSLSTVGPQAEAELSKYHANFSFLGVSGLSISNGFTSSDLYEAEMKKAMVSSGSKVVVLADHSKLHKAGLTAFCSFNQVDIFITSNKADSSVITELENQGIEVFTVDVDE